MFKKNYLFVLAVLSPFTLFWNGPSAQALDLGNGDELGVSLDFTYASKYMWHGFDVYQDHGGFQPSLTLDYHGFFAGAWASWPDSSGYEDLMELDLYFGYDRTFFEESPYALSTHLAYYYYAYPKTNSDSDVQEMTAGFSLPNLIPLGPANLVPFYNVYYDWSGVQSGSKIDDGWFHDIGISYDLPVPAVIPTQEKQAVSFQWDATYSDGALDTRPAWSFTTVGVSTTFEFLGVSLTPAVNYQWSLEDTVNPEDDFYATFSLGYRF